MFVKAVAGRIVASARSIPLARRLCNGSMASVPEVDIDPAGRFKYILIKGQDKTGSERWFVRGYKDCAYHGDVLDKVSPALDAAGLKYDCVGGGRIERYPDTKTIKIYGHSQGYGLADHAKSAELVRRALPDYEVSWSNDGY